MGKTILYTCPICGKQYVSPMVMADCAKACARKLEYEQNKEREKQAKLNELQKVINSAYVALQKAIADYEAVGGEKDYVVSLRTRESKGDQVIGFKFGDNKDWTPVKEWFTVPDNVKIEFVDNFDNKSINEKLDKVYKAQHLSKDDNSLEDFLKTALNLDDVAPKKAKPKSAAQNRGVDYEKELKRILKSGDDKALDEYITKMVDDLADSFSKLTPSEKALFSAFFGSLM